PRPCPGFPPGTAERRPAHGVARGIGERRATAGTRSNPGVSRGTKRQPRRIWNVGPVAVLEDPLRSGTAAGRRGESPGTGDRARQARRTADPFADPEPGGWLRTDARAGDVSAVRTAVPDRRVCPFAGRA